MSSERVISHHQAKRMLSESRRSSFEWDIQVVVTGTLDDDGFIGAQPDAYGEQKSGVNDYEAHYPYGLYSRPLDSPLDGNGNPTPAQAHQALTAVEGGIGHILPLENPSVVSLLPNLQPGETLFHGPLGQFVRMKATGEIVMWSPSGSSSLPDSTFSLSKAGFSVVTPFGTITLDQNGFHVLHGTSSARLDLGGIGGLPGPLSSLGSYFSVQAGSAELDATAVVLGQGARPDNIPSGLTYIAFATQVYAALQAIAAGFAAGGSSSSGPVVMNAIAAVQAAVEAIAPVTPVTAFIDAVGTSSS